MLEKLKHVLSDVPFLLPADIVRIGSAARIRTFEKGDMLFMEGERHYHAYIVVRGLLRSYVLNEEGKEVTILFVPERERAASMETFLNDAPSSETVEALEKTTAIAIDTRKIRVLASDNPRLLKLRIKLLEKALGEAVARIKFHTVLSPEARYQHFRTNYPKLEERIKQRHLSSYLGVTPQSLSRIRGRMDEN